MRATHLAVVLVLLAIISAAAQAAPFTVAATPQTWEAEQATPAGQWQAVADPGASGGKYLEAPADTGRLEYRFHLDQPTTLRVRPRYWRTSSQQSAQRFPYPLPREFGPNALDYCGSVVFFLASDTGQVGRCDVATGKLLPAVPVGGYLTDLVTDRERNLVYVTDAQQDRLVVLDGQTGAWRGDVRLKAQPWSLALAGPELYVACRAGKCVQVLDLDRLRVRRTVKLAAQPMKLEATGNPVSSLIVRFQQSAVQAVTLEEIAPDQVQYNARAYKGALNFGKEKRFEADRDRQVIKVIKGGKVTAEIDVKSVTADGTAAPPPGHPANLAGPAELVLVGERLFFTAPQTGRVGVVDATAEKLLGTVNVGGWVADLAAGPKNEKLYVADAAGGRVVIVDPGKLQILGEVKVPAGPVCLELAEGYALQRPYMVPPARIDKLFVACATAQALAAIDLKTDQVVRILALGYQPRYVKLVPPPNPDWWPILADDRIPLAMTPRVGVEPQPQELKLADLSLKPVGAAEAAPKRGAVKLTAAGQEHTVSAPAQLALQVDKAVLDVSGICDPQVQYPAPLEAGDTPGSLTVAVDGGEQYDWRRGIWTRPDNGMMLVAGTEEYWRWNAPAFRLLPGDHVLALQARGEGVELDAVDVSATADLALDLTVRPEPWSRHSQVPGSSYQGLFYDQEPVQFAVTVSNTTNTAATVEITGDCANYLGEKTPLDKPLRLTVPARGEASVPLSLNPAGTGRFVLTLNLQSPRGALTRDFRFVRLPKLTHPRLLFREADLAQIKQRLAKHPRLYARYADWLKRMSVKEGKYPERFLPNGLLAGELAKLAPDGTKDPQGSYGWRMYELAWRMVATQFAARYIPGADSAALDARMKPLVEAPKTDYWVQYHHHGPFFPGAVESLVDMAPADVRPGLPLNQFFAKYKGDINVMPFTIMQLEEPLSPADRALVYELATMHANYERYFEAHEGLRGGTWWQNPWSWCYCPTQGIFLSALFSKNFLGEDRYFEKPFFRGYLTFMEFADPITDKSGLLPALRRPSGEPWRWILASVARHPLEKGEYAFDDWVRQLNGDLPQPETQAVDDLMSLKGHPLAGPYQAAPHAFNTAVAIPIAMALGWYDPDAPTVTWPELPPTALFNPEGWAMLRSGWDAEATEVMYMCGLRDHTCRQQPNHFTVVRGGEYLFGTPSLWADDGNCQPAWGNTVVAGDAWADRWRLNLHATRSLERPVINRFSPENWAYLGRDRSLSGYSPAESGWGGGINMHGHTETLMVDEGRVLAYQTAPEFDYVAGEAAGAWPVSELRSHTRQIVFLKPNVVVVYDRVRRGSAGLPTKWLACTGTDLAVDGQRFTVKTGAARLAGQVLLPAQADLTNVQPLPGAFYWKTQDLLQVSPPAGDAGEEYLVVLTTGREGLTPATTALATTADTAGVSVSVDGRRYEVTFARRGPLGGALRLTVAGQAVERSLAAEIKDTYAAWKTDPRFRQWTTEPRFEFLIPPGDRVR